MKLTKFMLYVVMEYDYDGTMVHGIFSRRSLAQAYIDEGKLSDAEIEEHELNPDLNDQRLSEYQPCINRRGEVRNNGVYSWAPNCALNEVKYYRDSSGEECMTTRVKARNWEHAHELIKHRLDLSLTRGYWGTSVELVKTS